MLRPPNAVRRRCMRRIRSSWFPGGSSLPSCTGGHRWVVCSTRCRGSNRTARNTQSRTQRNTSLRHSSRTESSSRSLRWGHKHLLPCTPGSWVRRDCTRTRRRCGRGSSHTPRHSRAEYDCDRRSSRFCRHSTPEPPISHWVRRSRHHCSRPCSSSRCPACSWRPPVCIRM